MSFDNNIFKSGLINFNIVKYYVIDNDISQKYWYIDNQYVL